MRKTPPEPHDVLVGTRIALYAEAAPAFTKVSAALIEHGARVEQMVPGSRWWLRNVNADVALVHVERAAVEADAASGSQREVHHLLQALARTERVIGLLDDPPIGTAVGLQDFVLPPFRPDEVIPRIVRVLSEPRPTPVFEAGNLQLNLSSRTAVIAGAPVDLTFHEFEILRTLLAANGAVLTREELSRRVWGEEMAAQSRRMDIHIHRLRSKLARLQGAGIDTVRNVGYRLTAPAA